MVFGSMPGRSFTNIGYRHDMRDPQLGLLRACRPPKGVNPVNEDLYFFGMTRIGLLDFQRLEPPIRVVDVLGEHLIRPLYSPMNVGGLSGFEGTGRKIRRIAAAA